MAWIEVTSTQVLGRRWLLHLVITRARGSAQYRRCTEAQGKILMLLHNSVGSAEAGQSQASVHSHLTGDVSVPILWMGKLRFRLTEQLSGASPGVWPCAWPAASLSSRTGFEAQHPPLHKCEISAVALTGPRFTL